MMTIQIAILLNDTLQRIGMQSIVEEFFPQIDVVCEMSQCVESHIYITDSATYASMQDFFITRRARCLVVSSRNSESESPRIISTETPLEKIVDEITSLINLARSCDDGSQTGNEELSAREIQVLTLIVSGAINKEIAAKLNISLNTVLTHRKNITTKLGIKTVSGLTLYSLMHGYIRS